MAGTPISTHGSVLALPPPRTLLRWNITFTDVPFWNDLLTAASQSSRMAIFHARRTGLGFTLNEEAVKEHLIPEDRGFFEPTPQWDTERSWDRLWS
jgi:hypothetical protein